MGGGPVITHRVGRLGLRAAQGSASRGRRYFVTLLLVAASVSAALVGASSLLTQRRSGTTAQADNAPEERRSASMFLFGGKDELGECRVLEPQLTFWAVSEGEEQPEDAPPQSLPAPSCECRNPNCRGRNDTRKAGSEAAPGLLARCCDRPGPGRQLRRLAVQTSAF